MSLEELFFAPRDVSDPMARAAVTPDGSRVIESGDVLVRDGDRVVPFDDEDDDRYGGIE